MDNPYVKREREREQEVHVTLRGKHLSKLRSLLWLAMQASKGQNNPLLREIDQILYDATQRI